MGHLTALRLVNLSLALLALGTAAAIVSTWTLPFAEARSDEAGLAWLGALGGSIFAGLGVAHVLVALALGRGRGRALQTLLALALIVTFPIGTAYALYALWVCWAHPVVRRHLSDDGDVAPLVLSAVRA
jgi:hypothetical protein